MNEAVRKFFEELDLIMSEGDTKAALTHLMDSAELIRFAALQQQKNENIPMGYIGERKDVSEKGKELPPYEPVDYAHNQPDLGKMEK